MQTLLPSSRQAGTPNLAFLFLLVFSLLSVGLQAQTLVTGSVADEDGFSLIGVSVYPEGTVSSGTVTDLDGKFSLTVPAGEEYLIFSYTGYSKQRVAINNRTKLKILMKENAAQLQEVVVIAYGEAKAEDVIGAVDQVTAKEIENLQVNSFDQALAGQTAGLQVRTGSGRPDGGAEILLRGVSSTGDNAPLLVLDGVPFGNYNVQQNNLLSLINPNDIESISVIRDASGKALYGSRAANGLILITTKRGRTGKPTINFNLTSAYQTIPEYEKPNNLNATELAQFLGDRQRDIGVAEEDIDERFLNPERYGEGTDWYDLLTRTGQRQNADISIRGGTDKARYSLAFGYVRNQGVIKETDFNRYTMRATIDADITDWLSIGGIFAPSQTISNVAGTDPGTGQFQAYHAMQIARWADPTAPAYDDNGELTRSTLGSLLPFYQSNPLFLLENQQRTENNRRVQTQFTVKADIIPGLSIKNTTAANVIMQRGRRFRSSDILQGATLTPNLTPNDPQALSSASVGRSENLRLYNETMLNFNKKFGDHSVDALAGYITEYTQEIFLNAGGSRVVNEDFDIFNSGNIARFNPNDPTETRIFFSAGESESEQALISHVSRVQYNYKSKYYATANLRRDASSRFGPGLRAAYFPAGALAWRASNEPWFPKGIFSNLRFELSVGETGNNRIGNYQFQGNVGRANYVLGNVQADGFTITSLPNPLLKWETQRQIDLGVEMGFLQDRYKLEVTFYEGNTIDLLFSQRLPIYSGFGNIISNNGDILNRGVEFQLSAKPVVKDDFVWTVNANLSVNRTTVGRLGEDNTPIILTTAGNGTQVSRTFGNGPVGNYYGLNLLGLYTQEMLDDPSVPRYNNAVVGSPFYEDGDGDGRLEIAEDYVDLGNPFPDFNYGFNSFITYKDLGVRIVGYGEQGSLIYDLSREIELNTDGVFNVRDEVFDRFRPGDTDFSVRAPIITQNGEPSRRYRTPTSAGVYNGSFFRISNITLSYKLNRLFNNIDAIRGATASFAIQNVFVISPFYGNPEAGRNSGAFERNINYNTYPSVRSFTFGLNVNL
ncbi:SusC/RagA family TonB-linked outer membrane protein [Lewinella sp. 4G2]|uniref:SusC/RagA family TonB-linked outer membrane protein n=1 Tax=Lewinella sp. 4G2 TaxID=1803372 RepID=UPI0007B4EB9A|nr:SusC/RagA family TonB-linked outer membrane protein [Lewinella sp. 4G2]OAV44648.1 hypothetical protein A3850_009155 [Lewinella sp. 4G2]